MTLLMKTRSTSLNSLGNIHGYNGPKDFAAMLDFSRGEYYSRVGGGRKDYSLAQTVSVLRATPSEYTDRYGVVRLANANEPRIHLMSEVGLVGLLVEPGRNNLVVNPLTPVTQNITVPSASENILVSFEGTGDVSATANELTLVKSWFAGGRNVKLYSRSVNSAFAATLTVTGVVTKCYAGLGTNYDTTFQAGTRPVEIVTLLAPFKDLFSAGAGTLICRYVFHKSPIYGRTLYSPSVNVSAGLYGGLNPEMSVNTTGGPGTASLKTGANGTTTFSQTPKTTVGPSYSRSFVQGVGFSGFGANALIMSNGQVGSASGLGVTFGAPDIINLGNTPNPVQGTVGGIITHAVFYQRMLTPTEAYTAGSQWLTALDI